MPDTDLDEVQTARLAAAIAKADAQNAAIGVTGPEVAEFNLREAWISLTHRRGFLDSAADLRAEHEAHPVTQKIRAYQKTQDKEV